WKVTHEKRECPNLKLGFLLNLYIKSRTRRWEPRCGCLSYCLKWRGPCGMCPPGPNGAVLPPPPGTLTQLEMFQKPLKVLGRTLGHTRLGVFCRLEVIDFDPFFGFLLLALHVCYFSSA